MLYLLRSHILKNTFLLVLLPLTLIACGGSSGSSSEAQQPTPPANNDMVDSPKETPAEFPKGNLQLTGTVASGFLSNADVTLRSLNGEEGSSKTITNSIGDFEFNQLAVDEQNNQLLIQLKTNERTQVLCDILEDCETSEGQIKFGEYFPFHDPAFELSAVVVVTAEEISAGKVNINLSFSTYLAASRINIESKNDVLSAADINEINQQTGALLAFPNNVNIVRSEIKRFTDESSNSVDEKVEQYSIFNFGILSLAKSENSSVTQLLNALANEYSTSNAIIGRTSDNSRTALIDVYQSFKSFMAELNNQHSLRYELSIRFDLNDKIALLEDLALEQPFKISNKVTITHGEGGTVNPQEFYLSPGQSQVIIVTPDEGYRWIGTPRPEDCSAQFIPGTDDDRFRVYDALADCQITVGFKLIPPTTPHNISFVVNGEGIIKKGYVAIEDITIPITVIEEHFPPTFQLEAAENYHLTNASGCNGQFIGNTLRLPTVTQDCIITVTFSETPPETYTVTIAPPPANGRLDVNDTTVREETDFTLPVGSSLELSNYTNNGFVFNASSITSDCNYTIDGIRVLVTGQTTDCSISIVYPAEM